jgi:hypothetical protein
MFDRRAWRRRQLTDDMLSPTGCALGSSTPSASEFRWTRGSPA